MPWQNPGAELSFVLKGENKGRWEILPQDSSPPLVQSLAANLIARIRADITSFFLLCNWSSSPPMHTDPWGRLDKDLAFAALIKKAPSSFAEEPSITNTSNPPNPAAPHSVACRILIPQPRIEPVPPGSHAVEAQSPNHWTVRKFPLLDSICHSQQGLGLENRNERVITITIKIMTNNLQQLMTIILYFTFAGGMQAQRGKVSCPG